MVVEAQIGQVVREVGKVVPDANLQVVTEIARYCCQRATTTFVDVRHVEHSHLDQQFPVLTECVITPDHVQACTVVEELRILTVETDLTQAIGVLAANR